MIGHSRGGSLTILKAAEDPRIKAIATWAAVSDLSKMWPPDMIKQWKEDGVIHVFNVRTEQNMPLNYQLVDDFIENQERLDIPTASLKVNCPWLICHGTNDETVDVQMAYDLNSRNNNSELLIINGTTHTFGGGHPYNSNRILKPSRLLIRKTRDFFQGNI